MPPDRTPTSASTAMSHFVTVMAQKVAPMSLNIALMAHSWRTFQGPPKAKSP